MSTVLYFAATFMTLFSQWLLFFKRVHVVIFAVRGYVS